MQHILKKKKLLIAYLKFKFHWVSCISICYTGNPSQNVLRKGVLSKAKVSISASLKFSRCYGCPGGSCFISWLPFGVWTSLAGLCSLAVIKPLGTPDVKRSLSATGSHRCGHPGLPEYLLWRGWYLGCFTNDSPAKGVTRSESAEI